MLTISNTVLILSCLGLFVPTVGYSIFAIIGAGTAVITAGTSLVGTTLAALTFDGNHRVTCGIEVENWTKYVLSFPVARVKGGVLSTPPVRILPAQKEVMVSRKTSWTATGVYGTASWLIESKQRRLVVMWSAPYDFNLHSNYLAVGITTPGHMYHAAGHTWFDKMYYNRWIAGLPFQLKEFYRDFSPIIFDDADFQVVATMGSSHRAQVKIHIRPKRFEDYATEIKNSLQKK